VDFCDADLPWRYTPAAPDDTDDSGSTLDKQKLRPWLALVVLSEDEFEEVVSTGGPMEKISLLYPPQDIFPDQKQIWAWAHVQINDDVATEGDKTVFASSRSTFQDIIDNKPELICSRIICPRKLKADKTYHAFLIPAFESGRQAGLGNFEDALKIHALQPSWDVDSSDNPGEFPVFYRWKFSTSAEGDFEALASLIQPGEAIDGMGKMPIDISNPGPDSLAQSTLGTTTSVLNLDGVLEKVDNTALIWSDAAPFKEALADLLNPQDTPSVDPVISPPIYGRWHAGVNTVDPDDDGWLNELNLDPCNRVAAGIGSAVVKRNKSAFLQMAWKQVKAVKEANAALKQLVKSQAVMQRFYNKNYRNLQDEEFLSLSSPMQKLVMDNVSGNTVYYVVADSDISTAMGDSAFRTIARPGATTARVMNFYDGYTFDLFSSVNSGTVVLQATSAAQDPDAALTVLDSTDLNYGVIASGTKWDNFVFTSAGSTMPSNWTSAASDNASASTYRGAYVTSTTDSAAYQDAFVTVSGGTAINITSTRTAVDAGIDPDNVYPLIANNTIITDGQPGTFTASSLDTVMAAPVIDIPLFGALAEMNPNYLIPNFNLVEPNTITLLETNNRFLESFMVGANHEFSRELLWNEYPTDQRGSCFRTFWQSNLDVPKPGDDLTETQKEDLAKTRNITPINTWDLSSHLGSHNSELNYESVSSSSKLVLVIKADLLKRFPNVYVYAQKAKWGVDTESGSISPDLIRGLDDEEGCIKDPVFYGCIDPDVMLIGFDLTQAEARGATDFTDPDVYTNDPGWFFVLQERTGETRFGLEDGDMASAPTSISTWVQLTWAVIAKKSTLSDLDSLNYIDLSIGLTASEENPDYQHWEINSANIPYVFMNAPSKLAIHASNTLPS
jgi:hypothetical protein